MALATRPKKTAATRKRRAEHHRHSKHYLKTYWPYLPMLLIVGLGLMINSVLAHNNVLGAQSDFSSASFLTDTNNQRLANHEALLTVNSELAAAAQAKASDMAQKDYWSHDSPSGETPWSFITASGYQYQAAGENLAYGFANADQTVTAWMNSPDHRANILNANYQNVGFGVAESSNYQGQGPATIIVAEYAEPSANSVSISFNVPKNADNTAAVKGTATDLQAQRVARVQLWTGGNAAWSLAVVSAIAGAAIAVFVVRHGFRVHRLVSRGEAIVAHHPYLDILIVFVIMACFVLTRTGGLIR